MEIACSWSWRLGWSWVKLGEAGAAGPCTAEMRARHRAAGRPLAFAG